MSLQHRLQLYRDLEAKRGHPLIVYVTSDRINAGGSISSDVVRELLSQLSQLPDGTDALDLLLVSQGGDPTVSWRIVSLIREQVKKFSVLIPQAAYSAATLIALGADEIVMHPYGNLGPTDPQITGPRPKRGQGSDETVRFGSEDLSAFLKFAREEVELSESSHLLKVFEKFCDDVGTVPIGVAARSSQLSISMGEKLLQLHMKGDAQELRAREIAEKLTKDFFHHGYPVNRSEAQEIGLPIADRDEKIESLIWTIWLDLVEELELRKPFIELEVLRNDPACQELFTAVPMSMLPANLPPHLAQPLFNQIVAQIGFNNVPGSSYKTIHAVMESRHYASQFVVEGLVFGTRLPDLQFKLATVQHAKSWVTTWPEPKKKPEKKGKKKAARKKAETKKKAKK